MIPSILLSATQRELIRQVSDVRSLAYGGYFGTVVPDVDRNHNDLYEFDGTVTSAADLVARGATSVHKSRQINTIAQNKAVQILRSENYDQQEAEWLATVGLGAPTDAIKARALDTARNMQRRNREGAEITRGYLISSMVVGEITWSQLGFVAESIDFRMPAVMKATPTVYWRTTGNVTNATATPLTDMFALDYQASILGAAPFDMLGLSYQGFLAMTGTTEYQNRAIEVMAVRQAGSLPNAQSDAGKDLAQKVTGKKIVFLDQTFIQEDQNGTRNVVRYTPERLATLWHSSDEGSNQNWEFSNVPLTKSIIASFGQTNPFGGIARGPAGWGSVDDKEFTHAALYLAQEGFPMRRTNGVTAVIETKG